MKYISANKRLVLIINRKNTFGEEFLTQLIYKGLSAVKTITKIQYEQVLKTDQIIVELYNTIKEF